MPGDQGNSDGADRTNNLLPYMAKVAAMVKQLEALKQSLSTKKLEEYDDAEVSVRLDFVEKISASFEEAQSTLEQMVTNELDSSERMNFVSLYFDVKAKLTRRLNETRKCDVMPRSSTVRQFSVDGTPFCEASSSLAKTRLPEIQLPKFGGAYADWPNFYALFSTVVDDSSDLSDLEKFHHLRSSLTGSALDTIASLELNNANYKEAVTLLKNRFDNKLLNFQTHVMEMFSVKAVSGESAVGLRHLSDKFNAHLRAMLTISNKEQIADGLLIYLATTKMDKSSQMKWEESLQINELPTWDSLAKFLERRCRMLENLENSVLPMVSNQQMLRKANPKNRHVHVATSSPSPVCTFCNAADHLITSCNMFRNLAPTIRYKEAKKLKLCLNCLRKGHFVNRCSSGGCRHCSLKHHTMLHIEAAQTVQPPASPSDPTSLSTSQAVLVSSTTPATKPHNVSVLLTTAIVLVKSKSGNFLPCRAILDSASQLNLMSSRFVRRLSLRCNPVCATISGVGEESLAVEKSVDVVVKSRCADFVTSLSALVVPTITDYQPGVNVSTSGWNIPKNVQLADPTFNKGGNIELLIGAELFFKLMSVGQIKLAENLPILQKTVFGWVIAGGGTCSTRSCSLAISCSDVKNEEDKLSAILKSFWEVENNFQSPQFGDEDLYCETHFQLNTTRLASGAYSVRLPTAEGRGVESLGGSYEQALHRFNNLEKKFRRHPEIKAQYVAFMSEYIALNHMSLVSPQVSANKYFLPHHCVHKLDSTSTKLRVVFDGSARTTSGLSLNDILCAGPSIQPKLFITLLRYRFFEVALSGDICKMYRCVRVSSPDNYLQCILWRENETEELKIYKLDTVTYGTKPAAFLAIRAMHQLAEDEGDCPLGAQVLKRDFYVDDLISGGNSTEEVVAIRQQVAALLQRGEFVIRKWCSNVPKVLEGVSSDQCETLLKFHDGTDVTKTLGLVWDPKDDIFIFDIAAIDDWKVVTKRSILSSIARLYDPLGLIGPVITKAKIFMQHLWKLNLQWDESLPQSLHSAWIEYVSHFNSIRHFTFPRYISLAKSRIELHGFCDASLAAYGACIYVRCEDNNIIKTSLLCSKSRVAPLKTLTVPKLELSAANLLSELIDSFVNSLPIECNVHCWSDSTVVLSWLREQPSNFNPFVSNRVSRIQSYPKKMTWHYVPTKLNPADILSRGATPEELLHSQLWNFGPDFLSNGPSTWPEDVEFITELPERRKHVLVMTSMTDLSILCKYRNSFCKMQRIFAYVSRFLSSKSRGQSMSLSPQDIRNGTNLLIKNIQLVHFSAEHRDLKSKKSVSPSSKLYSLAPILDDVGLIRVGGRLQNSCLSFDAQHPIILPKHHPFTASMVMHFHQKLLHAGSQCLLASIRQQYWPVGGRKSISSIIAKCLSCFKTKPKLCRHIMGSLPADRVKPNRAFHTTGVDFCGPFYYKSEVKSRPPTKCYMCIFICFSTKATHLEVVNDLSTPSFLCALRRFVATRGKPQTIWSDNATNFVGAKNELADLKQLFLSQSHQNAVHQQCLSDGIEWKFIPPRSPHFGGLWEAAVKSAKYHFYRTTGLNTLTFEELRTLVCQIAAILNSRPLCPISEDPEDLEVLTPGHFLVGGPLVSLMEPDMAYVNFGHLNSWQRVCEMQQIFWRKWSSSYLSLLQERSKWREQSDNIKPGTMVILKEDNVPPLKWQMGRVTDVICGDDGVVRVVNVRTCSGTFKRAVSKIAVLPVNEVVEDPSSSTGEDVNRALLIHPCWVQQFASS